MIGKQGVNQATRAQGMSRLMFVLLSGAIILIVVPGCLGNAFFISGYEIEGVLVNTETGEPLAEARIELSVEAGETAFDSGVYVTDGQGAFQMSVISGVGDVVFLWPLITLADGRPPAPPVPDRVILLIGEGDEHVEVVIELNEAMIGEPDVSGDRTIELGTIFVPGGGA